MSENKPPYILKNMVNAHIETYYNDYIHIFTDGSVLENGNAGSAFVIPKMKTEKQYHLGKHYSIFTAELVAILMALKHIDDLSITACKLLLCVDSKSALQVIENENAKIRIEMILEIKHVIHRLSCKGINVTFFWVPSHCGIYGNELVDAAAKQAGRNIEGSIKLNINLDLHEYCNHFVNLTKEKVDNMLRTSDSQYSEHCARDYGLLNPKLILKHLCDGHTISRQLSSLMFKIRLNAFKTKFSKDIKCICGHQVSIKHLLLQCPNIKTEVKKMVGEILNSQSPLTVPKIVNDFYLLKCFSEVLHLSPVGILL